MYIGPRRAIGTRPATELPKKKRRPFIKNENIPDLSSDDKKGIKSKMST